MVKPMNYRLSLIVLHHHFQEYGISRSVKSFKSCNLGYGISRKYLSMISDYNPKRFNTIQTSFFVFHLIPSFVCSFSSYHSTLCCKELNINLFPMKELLLYLLYFLATQAIHMKRGFTLVLSFPSLLFTP